MTLYLLRHASAGKPLLDRTADRFRPLDDLGHAQALAIADLLVAAGATGAFSSPYLRCVQTLEPLADRLGTEISLHEEFGEGQDFAAALTACEGLISGSVVCSHGDLIPALIEAMLRRGMTISGPTGFRKASIWVIERSAEGEWTSATWWDRPRVNGPSTDFPPQR
jgi:8-oxo-dGTP diphosphatase